MIDNTVINQYKKDLKSISDELGFTDGRLASLVLVATMIDEEKAFKPSPEIVAKMQSTIDELKAYCMYDEFGNEYEEGIVLLEKVVEMLGILGLKIKFSRGQ